MMDYPMGPRMRRKLETAIASLEEVQGGIEQEVQRLEELIAFEQTKEKGLEDLYFFAKEILGFQELYEPLHRSLTDALMAPHLRRALVLWPRGHFKTTLGSIAYPLWILCRDQTRRIALCSKAAHKSEENLEEIRDRADRPTFLRYYGDCIGPPSSWPINRADRIKIQRQGSTTGPSIAAYSVETAEVGRHFDTMVFDDIVDQENVGTQTARDNVWTWFGRQMSVADPGSKIVTIGTRWHWDDVYSRIQKQLTKWEDNPDVGWYITIRKAIEDGKCIFPTRFTPAELDEIHKIQGDYIYSCFYMNEPVGDDVNPFDLRRVCWVDYKPSDDAWTYMFVDPASTRREYSSYTGIVIADALQNDCVIVRRAVREKMHPDELVDTIFDLNDKFQPRAVIIEDEAFQKSLFYWIRREQLMRGKHVPIRLERNPRNKTSEDRLRGLQPFIHNGWLKFARDMPGKEDMIEELETFPKGAHRDLLCALYFSMRVITPPRTEDKPKEVVVPVRARHLMSMVERRMLENGRMPRLAVGKYR